MNQQRITQSAPVKQGGQLPPSSHSQMRLQQMEKERLRLKQQELLRQRPQVRKQELLYLQKATRSIFSVCCVSISVEPKMSHEGGCQ